MHNNYGSTTLEEALRVYAEFHILEGQQVEWSKVQLLTLLSVG